MLANDGLLVDGWWIYDEWWFIIVDKWGEVEANCVGKVVDKLVDIG